jgi:hypothetical protein
MLPKVTLRSEAPEAAATALHATLQVSFALDWHCITLNAERR